MLLTDLATVKQYLRISHTAEDAALAILCDAAEEWIARYCGIRLLPAGNDGTVTEYLDGGGKILWATYRPVRVLVSVTNRDDGETPDARVMDHGIFRVDENQWTRGIANWTTVYRGGYLDGTYPKGLTLALFELAYRAHYARGGASSVGGPGGASIDFDSLAGQDGTVKALLAPFRYQPVIG